MNLEYRRQLVLWLLLLTAIATRWAWLPKVLLFVVALGLWLNLGWLVVAPSQRWRLLLAVLLLGILALPTGWLAVPSWPILWQLFFGIGITGIILCVANLIASRYATTIDG